MRKFFVFLLLAICAFGILYYPPLNLQKLSERDRQTVDSILAKINPLISEKEAHSNANLLTLQELSRPLSWKEKIFLAKILRLKPSDLGVKTPRQKNEKSATSFHELKNQQIQKDGKPLTLPPQALSEAVYVSYEKMMQAMEKDLGKKLYIESAHRGKAYHLYNFIKYLAVHQYSLVETGKLNALPGYSEHNLWVNHAIDLINAKGINGEPRAEDYENLPEHQWMLKHASEYGFTLSYPRDNSLGIAFEPWHWKHQETQIASREA